MTLKQIELTGVIAFHWQTKVNLVHRSEGSLGWLSAGDRVGDIEVLSVSTSPVSARLSLDGVERVVKLRESRIARAWSVDSLEFRRNTDADIAFDASLVLIFEEAQARKSGNFGRAGPAK